MEIKRLSDQMISESFAKHAQDVYILPASEVFYIYFRYGKKRTFWKKVSSADGQQLISRFKYFGTDGYRRKKKSSVRGIYLFFRKTGSSSAVASVGDYLQRQSLVIRLLYGTFETPHRCFSSRDFATILQKNRQTWIIPFQRTSRIRQDFSNVSVGFGRKIASDYYRRSCRDRRTVFLQLQDQSENSTDL